MPERIVQDDQDDRPERMIENPDQYFAEARERASAQVKEQGLRILSKKAKKRHSTTNP